MRAVLAAGALAAAACAREEPVAVLALDAETELAAPAALRTVADATRPTVEARLDGGRVARMLVDTGAELTVFDAGFADRSGLRVLPYAGTQRVANAALAQVAIQRVAAVERVSLGAASAKGLRAPLLDLAHFEGAFDGILGQDVLADWAVLFDARAGEVVLSPADPMELLKERFEKGTAFLAQPLAGEGRTPKISFDVRDAKLSMVVDTGSATSALPRRVADAIGAAPAEPALYRHAGGTVERERRRIERFGIGPWTIALTATLVDGEYGLLGYDVLREFVFVVDVPRKRVLLAHDPKRR